MTKIWPGMCNVSQLGQQTGNIDSFCLICATKQCVVYYTWCGILYIYVNVHTEEI